MPHVVLLGDSIFDNAAYVAGGPDVLSHLEALLPARAKATLLAVDGAVIADVSRQLTRVPTDATQLVVSVGGNDALQHTGLLDRRARSSAEVLEWFGDAVEEFEQGYRRMLAAVLARGIPTTVCTIYNGNLGAPVQRLATVALAIFNDAIQRVAREHDVPVIELRQVCTDAEDYANPIEPSVKGGLKIARSIATRLGLAAAALLLCAGAARAQGSGTYDGRSRQLDVATPRIESEVRIDGRLDEPAWRDAARLTGFSQYRPVDGRPAEDSTEVLVFYSPTAIHFGVRAFEAHGASAVRATLADRDNIGADDYVQILLDTYDDDRRALLFSVNPLGVQQDGVQSEGIDPGQGAGGRFDGVVDISPDFAYDSRGRVTADGWEVELRIPFKSLRYQAADPQRWGLQVKRITQHSGHEDTWTPAVRANASFLVQGGHLLGLTGLRRGLVLEVDPELTASVTGAPRNATDGDHWGYGDPRTELGGNLRWGITPNYTANATINPDFSQVESDVGQVTVNERFALFFPEKRPFFLDGLEQYDTPGRLIYTRQIRDPIAGVKLTGKRGATALAYLGA